MLPQNLREAFQIVLAQPPNSPLMQALFGQQRSTTYVVDDYYRLYWSVGYALGLDREMLITLLEGGPLPPKFRYRHFDIPKKDGTARKIVEPGAELKRIQRKLTRMYLDRARVHSAALAFREGHSIADHAWAHAGAKLIITADIEDFFPSTRRERVFEWWRSQRRIYNGLQAELLTKLTTYRGSLPQGAPTSPALSNAVNYRLDVSLYNRVYQTGGTYTRYADDMVFSWPEGCQPHSDFEHALRATLREHGYRLHPRKGWHVWYRRDEPEVTGLILTKRGGVEIPDSMKVVMRELKRTATTDEQKRRLAGYEGFRRMVER